MTPAEILTQMQLARAVEDYNRTLQIQDGRARRVMKRGYGQDDSAANQGEPILAWQLRPRRQDVDADQCHFGHALARTHRRKQDLVPCWRTAPLGATLCQRCYKDMVHDLQTPGIPLDTITPLTRHYSQAAVLLHGANVKVDPCHYGHDTSGGQLPNGMPIWALACAWKH